MSEQQQQQQQQGSVKDDRVHSTAQAFSLQTDAYEAARPSYPVEAVEFVLETAGISKNAQATPVTILDLAAGTGKAPYPDDGKRHH